MGASSESDLFLDLVAAEDPAPILHRLREEDPVHFVAPLGFWFGSSLGEGTLPVEPGFRERAVAALGLGGGARAPAAPARPETDQG